MKQFAVNVLATLTTLLVLFSCSAGVWLNYRQGLPTIPAKELVLNLDRDLPRLRPKFPSQFYFRKDASALMLDDTRYGVDTMQVNYNVAMHETGGLSHSISRFSSASRADQIADLTEIELSIAEHEKPAWWTFHSQVATRQNYSCFETSQNAGCSAVLVYGNYVSVLEAALPRRVLSHEDWAELLQAIEVNFKKLYAKQ